MPIDDILRGIARAARVSVDTYTENPRVNAAVNTAGIYVGIRVAGKLMGVEIEYLADLAAPIISAGYASNMLNNPAVVSSDNLRTGMKIGLSAFVGWDMADTITYQQGIHTVLTDYLQQGYGRLSEISRRTLDLNPTQTGAALGGALAVINRIKQHYNNL
jgi:hypothetical protein